jgi:FixJ family two-component response regulator
LINAIHDAIGKNRLARQARAKLTELQQRLMTLTPREREVLGHVVSGKKNRQIADDLGLAEKTIKVHRAHLMVKLKAQSLAELVKLAERLGVISSPPD